MRSPLKLPEPERVAATRIRYDEPLGNVFSSITASGKFCGVRARCGHTEKGEDPSNSSADQLYKRARIPSQFVQLVVSTSLLDGCRYLPQLDSQLQ